MSPSYHVHPFVRVFPPPQYLRRPAAGIDISDRTVKHLQLACTRNLLLPETHGILPVPEGVVHSGVIRKPAKLADILAQIAHEYAYRFAHVSLPEEHAYIFKTELEEDVTGAQARNQLEFKLKENVPLSPEEALFDFSYVKQDTASKDMRDVVVAVYPREIIQQYLTAFLEAGITPLSFEIEGQASARAIISDDDPRTYVIVDIGQLGCELSIVADGLVSYTAMLEISGDDFTEALSKYYGISYEEAETCKLQGGFLKNRENEKQFEALLGSASALRDEMSKHVTYWQMHGEADDGQERKIAAILLCGGSANLKGLLHYLNATMSVPVERANPWTNILSLDEHIPDIHYEESLRFATALGLALRSIARGG